MRVLFVASRFPYPPIQGDRVRAYHQLRLLSQRHRLTLVTLIQSERERERLKTLSPFCERIEAIPVSPWRGAFRLLGAPFTPLPLQTLFFFDPRFRQRVHALLGETSFDLVQVQLVRMAPVVDGLDALPKVLDLIDALSLNWYRRARQERVPLAWLVGLEAKRLQRYERTLDKQLDQLIVSSPVDREFIGAYENLHVIPNGVDIERFPFVEDGREPYTIIFTGRMGYFPNADAAVWFATQVFPAVRRQVPEARFLIVGADPPRRVKQLTRLPGIEVTGYVPDLHELLAWATVAVAPMQAGSGMQFKVLEAMASGTPVVATPYALGGIEAQDSEHLLVAQDGEAFAEQVVRLLNDLPLGRRLARNGRRLVEERYTWEQAVRMLEEVYQLALADFWARQAIQDNKKR